MYPGCTSHQANVCFCCGRSYKKGWAGWPQPTRAITATPPNPFHTRGQRQQASLCRPHATREELFRPSCGHRTQLGGELSVRRRPPLPPQIPNDIHGDPNRVSTTLRGSIIDYNCAARTQVVHASLLGRRVRHRERNTSLHPLPCRPKSSGDANIISRNEGDGRVRGTYDGAPRM